MNSTRKWVIGTIIALLTLIFAVVAWIFPFSPKEGHKCTINASQISLEKRVLNSGEHITVSVQADNPEGLPMLFNWQAVHGKHSESLRSRSPQSTYTAPSFSVDDTISVEITMTDCESVRRSAQVSIVEP